MDAEDDARTIGARLRQIRNSRKKSLWVVAGLAGISKSKLSRIERGEIALDSRSEIVALANALRIAPSELTSLPVPAPGDGSTDAAVNAVRLALIAASRNRPHGQVIPLDVLQRRVQQIRETRRQCGFGAVGERLPDLIGRSDIATHHRRHGRHDRHGDHDPSADRSGRQATRRRCSANADREGTCYPVRGARRQP
ncbi:MAG: helix-turn-helix domain-containing protein [Pseudonocardiales bacterium]|nr:helix-turn-helix domain-containing protein [Pseudonocardiales bacterium]